MAALKTRANDASVEAYLEAIEPESRSQDCRELCQLMAELSGEPARMWGSSIVGFGSYRYRYASGREGDWMLVAFANRKQSLTLYIMAGFDGYAELLARLGKHKTGKSCLYIARLEQVDRQALRELVAASIAHMRETGGAAATG